MQTSDPWWVTNLNEMQREMERYLQHMSQKKPRAVVFSQRTWQPAVDVYETTDEVVVVADLSGVPQEEIDLVVSRDALTLRGERRDAPARGERRYSNLEIPYGPFERTVQLPAAVDPENATASYRAGLLEIVLPKLSAAPPRRVSVRQS